MIKLKRLLKESVTFKDNDTQMIIATPKGEWKAYLFTFEHKGQHKVAWRLSSPPDRYATNGMGIGGVIYSGATTNLEQSMAELRNALQKQGLPYVQVVKLKPYVRDTVEHKEFIQKLQNLAKDFNNQPPDPNRPVEFGKGPPAFGQWISGDNVKDGILTKTIERYGDFWLIVKWAVSPRQQIKASEFLKNYDRIMHGKKAAGDYAREVYVKNEPFQGI